MTMEQESMALVVPGTGEVVDLANPDEVAVALDALKEWQRQASDVRQLLTRALVEHAARGGHRTKMRLPSAEVTISHPVERQWDLTVLDELRAAGLPDSRWEELVTVTVERKVSATVARQIASANPAYAEIIARAETVIEKPPTISVAMRAPS